MNRNLPDGMDPAELDDEVSEDHDDFEEPFDDNDDFDSAQAEQEYEDWITSEIYKDE
tara:strand:+ start:617 stop:787 length:171 start_codon:yes stop_codon:yes gene_type:complete